MYACVRFAQNRVNDDRMRQSLLFRVRVSEEKEKAQTGEKELRRRVCVWIREGVCESERVLVKTEKKIQKKKKNKGWETQSSVPISKDLLMKKQRVSHLLSQLSSLCFLFLINAIVHTKFPLSADFL